MPVKAAVLGRAVKALAGKGFKKEVLAETLEGLVSTGQIRSFALAAGKPGELSYSTASAMEVTGQILRTKVYAAAKPLKETELRKKLPPALLPNFEGALQMLVERGDVYLLDKGGVQVLKRAPRPSDFLDAAKVRTLKALLQQASSVRQTALTIDDFVAWLDGEAVTVPADNQGVVPAKGVLAPTEEMLRRWYGQDRLRSSTQMIPIPLTWGHYADWAGGEGGVPEVHLFKSLLQNLYNSGKVLLEPCERPQDLPEHERSLLVPLAIGPPGFAWSWVS
jgi:hypothetical protein